MMGKMISVKWCHSCQVGWGNDSEGASEYVKKDIEIMDRYNLSITHPKAGATLAECLHSRFEQMKSGVDFSSRRYFHNCAFTAEAYEQTRFLSLVGDHDRVLIIQVSPTAYVSETNDENVGTGNRRQVPIPIDQVVTPVRKIDLSHYIDSANSKDHDDENKVTGVLTGYISRIDTTLQDDKRMRGHFISVTKSGLSDDFYVTDDLQPEYSRNIGPRPREDWPKPVILFYTVTKATLVDECVDTVIDEYGVKIESGIKDTSSTKPQLQRTKKVKSKKGNKKLTKNPAHDTVAKAIVIDVGTKIIAKNSGAQKTPFSSRFSLPFFQHYLQKISKRQMI